MSIQKTITAQTNNSNSNSSFDNSIWERRRIEGLYTAIENINLAEIKAGTLERTTPRKEQAKAARNLFKKLSLNGVSVTAPNYSMAQSVHVRIPTFRSTKEEFISNGVDYSHSSYNEMPKDLPARINHKNKYAANTKIEKILVAAFPNHDDRSDSQTDYFDYCWSVR